MTHGVIGGVTTEKLKLASRVNWQKLHLSGKIYQQGNYELKQKTPQWKSVHGVYCALISCLNVFHDSV